MLQDLIKEISKVSESCILLSSLFKNSIFTGENISLVESLVPLWISECGINAECSWAKTMFEKAVQYNNNELTHKFLYYYDCSALVDAMRDRFSLIEGSLEIFYNNFSHEKKCEISDMIGVSFHINNMDNALFSNLNSIFIYMNSLLDLLYKVTYELENIVTDFKTYPRMTSQNVIFPQKKNISKEMQAGKTIFNEDSFLIKISNIRNRIIHNGSFDILQRIYTGITKFDDIDIWIMFPDMAESGFVKYNNRGNFYNDGTRINVELLHIIAEFISYVENTISMIFNLNKTKSIYSLGNEEEVFLKYESEIKQWSNIEVYKKLIPIP